MAGSAVVHEDGSRLSVIDRTLLRLEEFLNLMGGVVIFLVVLLAVANILGRKFLNIPVDGYIDWTEQSMAFFAFLGIAYCQREGGHIRMDILIRHFHGRVLWAVEFFTTMIMFLMTLVLIYGSFGHFGRAWTNGDSSFDIELPTWPSKLVVPFALTIMALRLFIQLWGYARAMRTNSIDPVAVPLMLDAAKQAEQEANTVSGGEDTAENPEVRS